MTTNAQLDAPGELATDGAIIYPNMAAKVYGYDVTGVYLTTVDIVMYGKTYRKTYTYTVGNKIATMSLWTPLT